MCECENGQEDFFPDYSLRIMMQSSILHHNQIVLRVTVDSSQRITYL